MISIDETKIELTTNEMSTSTNNETSTSDEFVKNFRFETMTTKLCLTKDFCEVICWLDEFINVLTNLLDKMIVVLIIFSYLRIKFATFSSFDKLRQSSNFDSYSRQRIKYSNSRRLIWRLLIKRSISNDLILSIFFSTNIESRWFDRFRRKKSTLNDDESSSCAIDKTRYIRQ